MRQNISPYKSSAPTSRFIRFCSKFLEPTSSKMKVSLNLVLYCSNVLRKNRNFSILVLDCPRPRHRRSLGWKGRWSHTRWRQRESCWILHKHRIWLQSEWTKYWVVILVANPFDVIQFKTSNSIIKEEVLDISKDIVTGSYEYVSPEGKTIKVTYTAGAGIGFNPRSTEDVIPAAIIDAIELNLKNPPETS